MKRASAIGPLLLIGVGMLCFSAALLTLGASTVGAAAAAWSGLAVVWLACEMQRAEHRARLLALARMIRAQAQTAPTLYRLARRSWLAGRRRRGGGRIRRLLARRRARR